jgi:hypothetical protein
MDKPLFVAAPRRLPQPKGPAEWGTPMPLLHRSIADIHEKDFVGQILESRFDRDMVLNVKGIEGNGARILREIELRRYGRKLSSDIDVMVVPSSAPAETTAIQVKRFPVKLNERGEADARANYFEELFEEGVDQANATATVGFSQVYLWIFVAVDSRAANGGRFTYDGIDSALRGRIEASISLRRLGPTVGLMDFEWVQAVDRSPLSFGSSGAHLRHLATSSRQQPDSLTAWIQRLVEDPA